MTGKATASLVGNKMLFTERQLLLLKENGHRHQKDNNAVPCVFLTGNKQKFLVSEICIHKPNTAYGLYIKDGHITAGEIDLAELYQYHEHEDFLFNDYTYTAHFKLSVFKQVAEEFGMIIADDVLFRDRFLKYDI